MGNPIAVEGQGAGQSLLVEEGSKEAEGKGIWEIPDVTQDGLAVPSCNEGKVAEPSLPMGIAEELRKAVEPWCSKLRGQ